MYIHPYMLTHTYVFINTHNIHTQTYAKGMRRARRALPSSVLLRKRTSANTGIPFPVDTANEPVFGSLNSTSHVFSSL